MPRGGRRDGAGAPHGNINALRKGNHSHRMLMVYLYCRHHPDQRALAMLLVEAGFISLKTRRFNGDVPGVVAFLYPRIIDSSLAGSIKHNQTTPAQPAVPPPHQLQSQPQTAPETMEPDERREKTNINQVAQPHQ
jgi:hypothetical protein